MKTPSTLTKVLKIEQLTFAYPTQMIFEHWSHGFAAGLTWVQGRNGAGKSTLLRILAGALPPRRGDLSILGTSLARDPIEYRRHMFWCGPGQIPFDHLTPTEYFGFMAHLFAGFDQSELTRHIDAFALHPHLMAELRTLSTGTQRKVWISAALAANTPVTLLDEPFNALDARSVQHLQQVLVQCSQYDERAWIVVSHDHLGAAAANASILDLSVSM